MPLRCAGDNIIFGHETHCQALRPRKLDHVETQPDHAMARYEARLHCRCRNIYMRMRGVTCRISAPLPFDHQDIKFAECTGLRSQDKRSPGSAVKPKSIGDVLWYSFALHNVRRCSLLDRLAGHYRCSSTGYICLSSKCNDPRGKGRTGL